MTTLPSNALMRSCSLPIFLDISSISFVWVSWIPLHAHLYCWWVSKAFTIPQFRRPRQPAFGILNWSSLPKPPILRHEQAMRRARH